MTSASHEVDELNKVNELKMAMTKRQLDDTTDMDKIAKLRRLFEASHDTPVPEVLPLHSTRTEDRSAKFKAIVLSANTKAQPGKAAGQVVPKLEVKLYITSIDANDAPDMIVPGLKATGCFGWGLPTVKETQQPLSGQGITNVQQNYVTNKRVLTLTEKEHLTVRLFCLPRTIDFWKNGRDGTLKKGMEFITPGMTVQVDSIVCPPSDDGANLWINGDFITPLQKFCIPTMLANTAIFYEFAKNFKVARDSAVRLSMLVRGFFTESGNKPAILDGREYYRSEAAHWFAEQWEILLSETSIACTKAAEMALAKGHVQAADVLHADAARIAGLSPCDVAKAECKIFQGAKKNDQQDVEKYIAAIVHHGRRPKWSVNNNRCVHVSNWVAGIFEDFVNGTDNVPETFAAPLVPIRPWMHTGCIHFHLSFEFMHSKKEYMKLMMIHSGEVPRLTTEYPVMLLKISPRKLAMETGLLIEKKALEFFKDMLQYGQWCTTAAILPRKATSDMHDCPDPTWTEDFFPLVRESLEFISVPVSEQWLLTNLAGGATQYIYEKDPDVVLFKESKTGQDLKYDGNLVTVGFQEITGASFKFATARMPAGYTNKKYCVWFPDVVEQVARAVADGTMDEDKLGATDVGENIVEANAKDKTIYDFLLQDCAVYVYV